MRIEDIVRPEGDGEKPSGAYTMAQFGKIVRLSRSSVARRLKDGTIRAIKVGRLVRVPASEVDRLLG